MIKLPWTETTAPNAMLEIVESCNVRCRVCYHRPGARIKPLNLIAEEIREVKALRKLHTLTLSGGEPTMHPELLSIVRMVKAEGLHCFLLTNGMHLDEGKLLKLKEAGLDSILFHVDCGQTRSDLPSNPTFLDVCERLEDLIQAAATCGLDVSVSQIIYEETDAGEILAWFLRHPELSFLFLSRAIDPNDFFKNTSLEREAAGLDPLVNFMKAQYGLDPFAFIPSNSGDRTSWISYFIPCLFRKNDSLWLPYKSTAVDGFLIRLVRFLTGRHIHKTRQNTMVTLVRVLINAAFRLRFKEAASYALKGLFGGWEVRHKMIVYDDGPFFTEDGELGYCEYCPTAILRNGHLTPCCTADYGPNPSEHAAIA